MKTLIYKLSLLSLLFLVSASSFSQELPPELRNFLIRFGEASSLGEYDPDRMITTVSENVMDNYIESFVSTEVMVFNDVYHKGNAHEYITVQDYCDLIAEHYPEGFRAFVYSPKLKKVAHRNGNEVYEIEVDKYVDIDFGMDNPPHIYFDPYSKLKLTVVFSNGEYKIMMIEHPDGALLSQSWINKAMPQSFALGGAVGNNAFNIAERAIGFGEITQQNGTIATGGLIAYWDIFGRRKFKMGLLAGLEYQKGTGSLTTDSYSAVVPMNDIDDYAYNRIITVTDIAQDYSYNAISVPLGLHFDYSLGQKWKPLVRSEREAKKRYPVKRAPSLQLNAGVKLNYINASAVDMNTGKYSYAGKYGFYNQITEDTTYVTISDLPEYGFYSDTTFSVSNPESSMNRFYVGGFASLNVKYPITTWCEVYGGAVMNFSLASVNTLSNTVFFTTEAGESSNLMAFNEVSMQSIGLNAGVVFNLKPPKQQYYRYPDFRDLKTYEATDGPKYRGSKMKTEITIASATTFRQKLTAEMTGEWLQKPETYKFSAGKTKTLKLKIPADASMKSDGNFLIIKPFGVEVTSVDCPGKNDVNSPVIEFPLNTILSSDDCIVNHKVNLKVEKLPDFNFVYVTLNGRDGAKARKDLTDELRKIYRKARFDDEEILVYISTEINRPVVFCNFDVFNLEYIDYKVFGAEEFDDFINEVKNKYNSAIEDKDDDIHNIELVIGDNFAVSERMNASRRYVNYYFLPVDARFYRVQGYIEEADNSVIQELILAITNKYCLDVPVSKDQYKVYVHLRADQYGEISVGNGTPMNECNNEIILY